MSQNLVYLQKKKNKIHLIVNAITHVFVSWGKNTVQATKTISGNLIETKHTGQHTIQI